MGRYGTRQPLERNKIVLDRDPVHGGTGVSYWWVTLSERSFRFGSRLMNSFCVDAKNKDPVEAPVSRLFEATEIVSIDRLPYPASPRLDPHDDTPDFCWSPGGCKGRSSCSRNPCCTN